METLTVGSFEYDTIAEKLQAAGVFYLNTDFQRIKCTVPEGQGRRQSVVVMRGGLESLGCGCSLCTSAPCFDYLPPVITSVTPLESPTPGGGFITLTGDNFGLTPRLFVGGMEWQPWNNTEANSTASHTQIIFEIAAFEGAGALRFLAPFHCLSRSFHLAYTLTHCGDLHRVLVLAMLNQAWRSSWTSRTRPPWQRRGSRTCLRPSIWSTASRSRLRTSRPRAWSTRSL